MQSASNKVTMLHTIKLKPGQAHAVRVGMFESTMSTPQLQVTSHPDIGDRLGISVTKLDETGDYVLICHIQNFSNEPTSVTIRSAE